MANDTNRLEGLGLLHGASQGCGNVCLVFTENSELASEFRREDGAVELAIGNVNHHDCLFDSTTMGHTTPRNQCSLVAFDRHFGLQPVHEEAIVCPQQSP